VRFLLRTAGLRLHHRSGPVPAAFDVDVFLPAASFAEAGGTITNVEGRVQEIVQIEDPPDGAITGFVRPDWFVFGAIAENLGCSACTYKNAGEIRSEISERLPGFPAVPDRRPRQLAIGSAPPWAEPKAASVEKSGRRLIMEPGGFRHPGST
jgi:NADH dehydrogenase/NADH:ubiquinone oxidoreductase subunit G